MDENTCEFGGRKFRAIAAEPGRHPCDGCEFDYPDTPCPQQQDKTAPECVATFRKDHREIIWKEVIDG